MVKKILFLTVILKVIVCRTLLSRYRTCTTGPYDIRPYLYMMAGADT